MTCQNKTSWPGFGLIPTSGAIFVKIGDGPVTPMVAALMFPLLITILLWPWTCDTKSHESCYLSITLMKPMDTVKVWLVFPIGKLPAHYSFQWSVSSSLIICSSMWKNLICHSALKVNLPRPSGEIKLPIFWTKRPRRKMESQHDPWSSGFATLWASQGV